MEDQMSLRNTGGTDFPSASRRRKDVEAYLRLQAWIMGIYPSLRGRMARFRLHRVPHQLQSVSKGARVHEGHRLGVGPAYPTCSASGNGEVAVLVALG